MQQICVLCIVLAGPPVQMAEKGEFAKKKSPTIHPTTLKKNLAHTRLSPIHTLPSQALLVPGRYTLRNFEIPGN